MALIPEEIIAQVIERCGIVEIISSYIPLKRAGRNFKANCPFHNEKTPSFVVNPDKQIFHCFGCGVGGNVVTFVMKQDRLEFPEAIRILAQKVNIVIPTDDRGNSETANIRQLIFKVNELAAKYFHNILLSEKDIGAKKAREYLKNRKIELATVQKFQLGFALDQWDGLLKYLKDQGITVALMEKAGLIIARENREGYYDRFRQRIMFPIFDTRGHYRAFGGRLLDAKADTAKYLNSPETPVYTKGHHLYGFHLAKDAITKDDCVVVVEGYVDCLMPHQAGVNNVVASLGTALTVEQIRLIRHYTKNVVMLYDMDLAGESAMIRSLDLLIEEGMNIRVATLVDGEDPDSFICKFGADAFREKILEAKGLFDYKLDVLLKRYDAKAIEGKAKISGEMLPTINKMGNAIIQSGYINRLAQILDIPERALIAELKKVEDVSGRKDRGSELVSISVVESEHRMVERNILKLLLQDGQFIATTKEEISLVDFQDKKVRDVVSKIYQFFEEGKPMNVGQLINSFEDVKVQEMISGLIADEDLMAGDKQKMHRDYINRIKNDRLKSLRQDLLQQIREAENTGDHEKLAELKEKFNNSVKR